MKLRAMLQTARVVCGLVLISFFLWTAHVVFYFPWPIVRYLIAVPLLVLRAGSLTLIDLICLALLVALMTTTAALNLRIGRKLALVKAVQAGSLMMLILGLSILAFDPSDIWLYVTWTQNEAGFVTWFTNGVELLASISVLVVTTYASHRSTPQR